MATYHNRNETWYDLMQVCENGHKITGRGESNPHQLVERCTKCGAVTLTSCPHCQSALQGCLHSPNVHRTDDGEPPEYCRTCGSAFPWTGKRAENFCNQEPISRVGHILDRFHVVAQQLRDRYSNRSSLSIDDEYDVQDLLHALLKLNFDDIRPEEWSPSYAGGSSRMDFLLKEEHIVVEVKKTSKHTGEKQIGDQLLVDIERYANHPDCKTLVCFVYDPDYRVGNPSGLANDLQSGHPQEPMVLVYIRPAR